MGSKRTLISHPKKTAATSAVACLFAGAIVLASALAAAQEGTSAQKKNDQPGFFGAICRWFDEQAEIFNSNVKDARKKFDSFGREAGVAAKTTADGAKDAADA